MREIREKSTQWVKRAKDRIAGALGLNTFTESLISEWEREIAEKGLSEFSPKVRERKRERVREEEIDREIEKERKRRNEKTRGERKRERERERKKSRKKE